METVVLEDLQAVASFTAGRIKICSLASPACRLALPTGRTAVPLYAELGMRHQAGQLDLAQTRTFNLDELILPTEHPASFHSYMARHAWEVIGLRREHCDIPSGTAPPAVECQRYDQVLEQSGALDLVILGIGADGHIAYNLPGQSEDDTHIVNLPPALADSLAFPDAYRPPRAITMGTKPLLAAREVVVMAAGTSKARAVGHVASGEAPGEWPCALLTNHPNLYLAVDRDAAGCLQGF